MRWAQKLNHRFFSEMLIAEYGGRWDAMWMWHYMRFKQTDQYFEDLPDTLGAYCAGGEL